MTITHFIAEWDSGQDFNFRAEQRDGSGNVLDSYFFAVVKLRRVATLFASMVDSGIVGTSQVEVKVGDTVLKLSSWG